MTDPTPGLLDEAAETTTHTEPVEDDCIRIPVRPYIGGPVLRWIVVPRP